MLYRDKAKVSRLLAAQDRLSDFYHSHKGTRLGFLCMNKALEIQDMVYERPENPNSKYNY